jgi:pyruvate decarboxylase
MTYDLMGKGIIDETHPLWMGIYHGAISPPDIQRTMESADIVLNLGPMLTASNTGVFSRRLLEGRCIDIYPTYTVICGNTVEGVAIKSLLKNLISHISTKKLKFRKRVLPRIAPPHIADDYNSEEIRQSWVWQAIGDFIEDDDIVLVEVGTSQFGMPDSFLRAKNVKIITQLFYSSIGYTVGACLGACLGQKDSKRPGRVILIVGDGSLQMTVQEVGTMARFGLTPIIFLINNAGYTVEREIHGPTKHYNDISMNWKYSAMLDFFGAVSAQTYSAKTRFELKQILGMSEFKAAKSMNMLEIFMDKYDAPWRMRKQIAFAQGNQAVVEKYNRLSA